MGDDGTIVAQGSYAEVLVKDEDLAREAAKENEKFSKATEELEDADDLASSEVVADGKLIVKEEIAEGHISLRARQCSFPIFPYFFAHPPAVSLYLTALGGKHPLLFWTVFVGGAFAHHALANFQV